MDKNYFPHATGGALNPERTQSISYNLNPNCAISMDPRNVITEWTTAALKTLTSSEFFLGEEIYCLGDNKSRVCRWKPSTGIYTAANALWDESYKEDKSEWVDVTEYTPVTSMEDRIAEEELKEWRFSILSTNGYWGFYNFDTDEPSEISSWLSSATNMNKVLTEIIPNVNDVDVLAKYINGQTIKAQTINININTTETSSAWYKSPQAFAGAADKLLFVMIPKTENLKITKIVVNDLSQDEELLMLRTNLECINRTTFDFDDVQYLLYVFSKQRFTANTLSMQITFE